MYTYIGVWYHLGCIVTENLCVTCGKLGWMEEPWMGNQSSADEILSESGPNHGGSLEGPTSASLSLHLPSSMDCPISRSVALSHTWTGRLLCALSYDDGNPYRNAQTSTAWQTNWLNTNRKKHIYLIWPFCLDRTALTSGWRFLKARIHFPTVTAFPDPRAFTICLFVSSRVL